MRNMLKVLLLVCGLFFSLALCSNAQAAAITWTWDTTGQLEKTINVQASAETTVDWGDGATETIAVTTDYLTLTHTYTNEGNYTVLIHDNVLLKLDCANQMISNLDVEGATILKTLNCYYNNLTSLDVSNNTALKYLYCYDNPLSNLDVSSNIELLDLFCKNTQLSVLDVAPNTKLERLYCQENQLLRSLNLTYNLNLIELNCNNIGLTSLDLTQHVLLTYLSCNRNQLTELDVSQNTALTELYCTDNQISNLDVSKNTMLTRLSFGYNPLTSIDLSKNTELLYVYCPYAQLTSLDVSNNTKLEELYCGGNQLTTLDVRINEVLSKLCATNSRMENLQLNEMQLQIAIEDEINSCNATFTTDKFHKHINTCIGALPHAGGTHENGGVCENCQGVYQTHGQSTTANSYTQQESGHIPVYSCTQDGCTVTYTGMEEAHTGSNSCELCGWVSENYDGSYTLTITYEGDVTTREVEVNRVVTFGLGDRSDAQYTVATENTVLRVYGNRRQFVMPAGNVEITIQN